MPSQNYLWRRVAVRIVVSLLLFTVAGLSTMAKDGKYYPNKKSAQHVSLSTKMDMVSPSIVLDRGPQQWVIDLVQSRPRVCLARIVDFAAPRIESVGVVVSMQLRSPPQLIS